MDSDDDDAIEDNAHHDGHIWLPRDILRRTNWLYRVDALRGYDVREMNVLWELSELCQNYATQLLVLMQVMKHCLVWKAQHFKIRHQEHIELMLLPITKMVELFWCEGYCYFLDYLDIAYYPIVNHLSSSTDNVGSRFPPI